MVREAAEAAVPAVEAAAVRSRTAVAAVVSGGGGGARGGGGGGRRSDMRLKHDIALLGHLDNGIGFYRFVYNGGRTAYVGVLAQDVQTVVPAAVTRGSDGYLRVPTTGSV